MKRVRDEGQQEQELEEGEELDDFQPVAGPSTFSLPVPPIPPPPPLLRLVVHHSSQNPSANLLPPHQSLVLIQDTTTIGRDKSYEPRIRLKTLEVSRTHATLFQQEAMEDPSMQFDDDNMWFIVDNASTHGTYLRRYGEEQYTRLSAKGQSSLPRQLKHLDTIKVANQRFIVHLHTSEEGGQCESCTVSEDRSNLIPLIKDTTTTASSSSTGVPLPSNTAGIHHMPMDEHAAKTYTKDQKRQNFRSNMHSLRKNLLAGGESASHPSLAGPSKMKAKAQDTTIGTLPVEKSGEEESAASIIEAPRYVDRAKLRRSIHPPQHGLSDADPPQGKRNRLSSPSLPSNSAARITEPSYGPGAALFEKMMKQSNSGAYISTDEIKGSSDAEGSNSAASKPKEMGKVIQVRTMAERSAGLGSGAVREGVEQHTGTTDWRDAARQRRWKEANR